MRLKTGLLQLLALLFLLSLAGCVCLPVETVTQDVSREELADHVEFLAQPRLKGRSAGSWESKKVRRYLCERLSEYGCEPWAKADSFQQEFAFGTNVIAVLPGSDPKLADEMILISAHYDHLKAHLFSYYPGACDNAAAVSVLLELAEKLSQSPTRPKRPICFAFFDAEENMCLGSFAFTCRDDYDESKIKAVINIDLLGRSLLDVVDNSLIVAGTERHALIEKEVAGACAANNLKFIPFETTLIGPVGDHIAFTMADRPVLFFTCGIFKDYHQSTDTPDKLDYEKLLRESATIEQTLLSLANAPAAMFEKSPAPITPETTESFLYVLNKFKDHADMFELDPNDIKTLDKLIADVNGIDASTISRADLMDTQREGLGDLLKLMKHQNSTLSLYSGAFLEISKLYAIRPKDMTAAYKETIRYYLNHHLSILSKNDFSYQVNLPMTAGEDWGIVKTGKDEFLFGAVNTEIELQNEISLFKGHDYTFKLKNKLTACRGPLERIIDYAIFGKDPNGLVNESHESSYILGFDDQEDGSALSPAEVMQRKKQVWAELLAELQQRFPDDTQSPAFQKYHDLAALFDDPNTCGCAQRGIFITAPASQKGRKKSNEEYISRSVQRLYDRSNHIEHRVEALNYLAYTNCEIALTAIANVLDDSTPYAMKPRLVNDPAFPLKDHPYVRKHRADKQKQYEKLKDKTLADIAEEKLKAITGKDFGKDKLKWKRWIDRHY